MMVKAIEKETLNALSVSSDSLTWIVIMLVIAILVATFSFTLVSKNDKEATVGVVVFILFITLIISIISLNKYSTLVQTLFEERVDRMEECINNPATLHKE